MQEPKKVVLTLDIHDNKCKKKVLKIASSVQGIDSMSVDMEKKKLTLIGNMDPLEVVEKLRKKSYYTIIDTIGPAKELEKEKSKDKEPEVAPIYYPYYDPLFHPGFYWGYKV